MTNTHTQPTRLCFSALNILMLFFPPVRGCMLPASLFWPQSPFLLHLSLACLSTPRPDHLATVHPHLLPLPPHLQPLPLTSSPSPILATQSDQASSLELSQNFSPGKSFLEQSFCGQGGSGEGSDSSGSIRGPEPSVTGVNGAQESHLHPFCWEPQMAVEVLLAQSLHSGARQSSEGCVFGQTGLRPPACSEIALLSLLERCPQPGEDECPATPAES